MSDNSIPDQSETMETHSAEGVQLSSDLPAERSETKAVSVSEAALQDGERHAPPLGTPFFYFPHSCFIVFSFFSAVETLRQLILRDLEEEGWSHDSDDTPTNEAAGERSLEEEEEEKETFLKIAEEDAQHQDEEQPGFQVVRKGRRRIEGEKNRFLI